VVWPSGDLDFAPVPRMRRRGSIGGLHRKGPDLFLRHASVQVGISLFFRRSDEAVPALITDAWHQASIPTAPIRPQRRIFIPGWVLSPCPSCSGFETILDCVSLGNVRLHRRNSFRSPGVSTGGRCLDVDGRSGMRLSCQS
jgi:hypothetical protein